jgi:hypothetical protein
MHDWVSWVYRVGPVSITFLMILASYAYGPWASYRDESWIVHLLNFCLGIALLWHIALIITERPKGEKVFYAFYGLVHLPAMFAVGFYLGMSLTGNWW